MFYIVIGLKARAFHLISVSRKRQKFLSRTPKNGTGHIKYVHDFSKNAAGAADEIAEMLFLDEEHSLQGAVCRELSQSCTAYEFRLKE